MPGGNGGKVSSVSRAELPPDQYRQDRLCPLGAAAGSLTDEQIALIILAFLVGNILIKPES